VLTGAPGLGKNGTAGAFKAPWRIIILMYKPEVAFSPTFQPITSACDIDAAEAAGVFLPINEGSGNPFEIETGTVLICRLFLLTPKRESNWCGWRSMPPTPDIAAGILSGVEQ
jgi:hypothetical protein